MARSENLHESHPMSRKATALSFLLVIVALMGLSSALSLVWWMLFVEDFVWGSAEAHRIMITLPVSLLISGAAVWGLMRLKPWGGSIAPTTRRTYTWILLSALILLPGSVALYVDTFSPENWYGIFSNSAISPGVAIFAIASWLLAIAIGRRSYYSADEHWQRANDFGSRVGAALFVAVTPAWWVAARAGLLPMPDALILWGVTVAVMTIGTFWYRYR